MPGVEEVFSSSSEGSSSVRIMFAWGTDLDAAADDVRERLDRIVGRLPEEVEAIAGGRGLPAIHHILKDGADSVGIHGALTRVYISIGAVHQEWLKHFNLLVGDWKSIQRWDLDRRPDYVAGSDHNLGIALALLGTFFLALSGAGPDGPRSLLLQDLVAAGPHLSRPWVRAAFVFLLVGYGTKAGLAPMHSWLPDAHGQAPAPVSGLMSGVLALTRFSPVLVPRP